MEYIKHKTEEYLKGFEEMYDRMLFDIGIHNAHKIIDDFKDRVAEGNDLTDNEAVFFHVRMSTEIYRLGTEISRQGLRSSLIKIYNEQANSTAFSKAPVEAEGKKLTKDDKSSIANLATVHEQELNALYDRVTRSVEQTLWGLKTVITSVELINHKIRDDKRMAGRE